MQPKKRGAGIGESRRKRRHELILRLSSGDQAQSNVARIAELILTVSEEAIRGVFARFSFDADKTL